MANRNTIRKFLLKHPEGLTTIQLHKVFGGNIRGIRAQLDNTIDFYIVGWKKNDDLGLNKNGKSKGQWRALWTAAVMPKNCPRPYKTENSIRKAARPFKQ